MPQTPKSLGLLPLKGKPNQYFGIRKSLHDGRDLAVVASIAPAKRQANHFYFVLTVAGQNQQSGYGTLGDIDNAIGTCLMLFEFRDMDLLEE